MTDRPAPLRGEPEIPAGFTYEQLFQRCAAEYIVKASLIDSMRRRGKDIPGVTLLADEVKFRQLADLIALIDESTDLRARIRDAARNRKPLAQKIAETFPTNPDAQTDNEVDDNAGA